MNPPFDFDQVVGSFGPTRNEERFCGPNSLVKNKYDFKCTFLGEETEEIRSTLVYDANSLSFSPAGKDPFQLKTVLMKRVRAEENGKIHEAVIKIDKERLTEAHCPL